jgi:cyclomaltodextrinase / maltogenic alpha-amylase / neopullulanase
VPESIRNRSQFFPAFRQAAKSENPQVYLVGEVWGRSPDWLQGNEFDALMNYAAGLDVIRDFVNGARSAGAAVHHLALLYAEYPEAATAMLFNIISSHDTSRLLTLLQGGSLGATAPPSALASQRLASAMLYALPGIPITFQGDECAFLGTAGNYRDEHRYPMQWQNCDGVMLAHYRQLGELRHRLPALRSPVIRSLAADGHVVTFLRGEPGAGEVLALFNGGLDARTVQLPAGNWSDAANAAAVSGTASVAGRGWRLLVRQ